MEASDAFVGLACLACGEPANGDVPGWCQTCGGILDAQYEYEALDVTRDTFASRPFTSMWRYHELLTHSPDEAVTMAEGCTPLVDCPEFADALGVARVLIKDEGRNPTATFKDRGHSLAITAAASHGASDIALASAGNAGQSAAAYATRAGLTAHVFVPDRAGLTQRALIRRHGARLEVVDGTLGDAGAAYEAAMAAHPEWYSTQAFVTPYRHEGKKTMGYEIVEGLDWTVPDAIVYPTGGGVGLLGIQKGISEFHRLGLVEGSPAVYAAQSTGCAPIVRAWEAGADEHEPWVDPDTICAGIEVADPVASPHVLSVLRETGGSAVATDDDAILTAMRRVATRDGVEMAPTSAAAASGACALADQGAFTEDDAVVVVNTGAGSKDPDV